MRNLSIIGQILIIIFFSASMLGCMKSAQKKRFEGIEIPGWFFSIPQQDDTYYVIGGCSHYIEKGRENLEAREMAAHRLACSIDTDIKVGWASHDKGSVSEAVQFVIPEYENELFCQIKNNLVVLDSFSFEGDFYILAAFGPNPHLNSYNKRRILLDTLLGIPKWVKDDPSNADFYYGVGLAQGVGPLAWERAEQNARACLIFQKKLILEGLHKEYAKGNISISDVISKQQIEARLKDARVVKRAIDQDGVYYALARLPAPVNESD